MSRYLLAAFLTGALCFAQNVSSSLRSNIVDPSGAAIVNAECALRSQATGVTTMVMSDSQGSCSFPIVQAGSYTLTVKMSGFKTLDVKDIVVTASETRTLGNLKMDVGGIAETVNVEGEVTNIQLASAEKSGTIDGKQLQQIAVKGRDFFALLTTIPGVVDNLSQARETSSPDAIRGTFINGNRENQKNMAIDGITNLDTGSNSTVQFEPNMDAIAEIKVLTSNYQAEYGRNGGGVITVITKSGSTAFHGTGYYNYRHESLNANSFFNNRTKTAKAPYRYRIDGYTIGGPAYIPKLFNKDKNKLFFFWSQEYVGMKKDYGTRFATMPTALERDGDFSKSLDSGGNLIKIYDPLSGGATQFPGNKIPKTQFNSLGLAMLNYFPLPNYVDPDPKQVNARNYKSTYSGAYPKREDLIRIDANPTQNLQVYWRYVQDKDEQQTPYGMWVNGNINYLRTPITFGQPGKGHVIHANYMFSPTLINEFIFGKSRNNLYFYPTDPSVVDRSLVGNPAQWYADSGTGVSYVDKTNYMPNLVFGGQPANVVNNQFGNIPYENFNTINSYVDNVSKVLGKHTLKAGFYYENTRKFQVGGRNPRGEFNFSTNANNPLDTKDSFANALVGVINSYSEGTARVNGDWHFINFEWYLQDNWRVSKRLTLDYGLRFYHLPPQYDVNQTIATFDPSLFSTSAIPALYRPAIDPATKKRVAQNPITGAYAPNPMIGLFVPNSGNFTNGAAVGGVNGYPEGLYTTPWLSIGPRIGFAYDVFGNGKTAIRGGFGMFKDRMQGNPTMDTNGNPPVSFAPTLYFGDLATYSQAVGALGPSGLNALLGDQKPSTIMNFSFGVQHQIRDMTIDVSYVGGQSRNLLGQKNINPIPMFARFDPNNADPTNGNKPLPDNFFRRYMGWGDINLRSNAYSSNYNALQMSINRRFARGMQIGGSYVWSKALGVADSDTSGVSPYFSPRMRNYGPLGFDRTHQVSVNYIYDLPNLGQRLNMKPLGWVTDNWELSGITSMVSGAPFTPGLGWTTSTEVTGSTEGARLNVVGDPYTGTTKDFYHWFNQTAFAAPIYGKPDLAVFGNMGQNVLRQPGVNNWDIAASKRFPLFGEGRFVQIRGEFFNAWNHTQYSGVDTGTSFDPKTGEQKNPNFGVVTGARPPRQIQLSARIVF